MRGASDAVGQAVGQVTMIGFGEAAGAFVSGWPRPGRITAFDVKTDDPAQRAAMAARYADHGVEGTDDPAAALAGAEAVFCLVTADRAEEAARAGAPHLAPGALWLDGNSCAPGTKRQAAEAVEAAGGRYVDVAVMAPVRPKGHRVPLLIAGPHAQDAARLLAALDMAPEVAGAAVGQASAVKMIRSVMIKGLEALSAECLLAARRAEVDGRVLASLQASDPGIDWPVQGAYNLERMMVHGARRAAEMREVAATLRELGLPDRMAAAAADWQAQLAALDEPPGEDDLAARADRLLARL